MWLVNMQFFVANFLGYAATKNYLNWIIFSQVFTKVKRVTFFETQCSSTALVSVVLKPRWAGSVSHCVLHFYIRNLWRTVEALQSKEVSHGLWGSAGLNMPIHVHFFRRTILTRKVSQTNLVFLVHDEGSLVGLWKQNYNHNSLCVAVTICATRVNISQTHTHTDTYTHTYFWPADINSLASWAKAHFIKKRYSRPGPSKAANTISEMRY